MLLCLNPFHPISLIIGIVVWAAAIFSLHKIGRQTCVQRWHAPSALEQSVVQKREAPREPDCECYVTTGPNPGFFQHFDFYDFHQQAVPKSRNIRVMPPSVNSTGPLGSGGYISNDSILDDNFRKHWQYVPFTHHPSLFTSLKMVNAMQNVFMYSNEKVAHNPVLLLRTTRNVDFQSIGEISIIDEKIVAVTMRFRTRLLESSKSGAPAGLTIFNHAAGEEFSEFSRTFFGNELSTDALGVAPFVDLRSEWGVRRLDYLFPYSSIWSNDKVEYVQRDLFNPGERQVSLSIWSYGSIGTDKMHVGDEAYIAVEWFMMTYNNTEDKLFSKRHCEKACKIDDLKVIGVPERVNLRDWKAVSFPKNLISDRLNRRKRNYPVRRDQSIMSPSEKDEDEKQAHGEPHSEDSSGDLPTPINERSPSTSINEGSAPTSDGNPSNPTKEAEPPTDNPSHCHSPHKGVSMSLGATGPPIATPTPSHTPPMHPPDTRPCCSCPRPCFTYPTVPLSPMQPYVHRSRFVRRGLSYQQQTLRNSAASGTGCTVCEDCAGVDGWWLTLEGFGGAKRDGLSVKSYIVLGGAAFVVVSILVVLGCS